MSLIIPTGLQRLLTTEAGQLWIKQVPQILDRLCQQWNLTLEQPFNTSTVSYVIPARSGADEVVLKIQWPHYECLHEADALQMWKGQGAVRLLDHDADANALLLERCNPGISLGKSDLVDKLPPVVALLEKLMIEARGPFMTLEEQAQLWREELFAVTQSKQCPFDKETRNLTLAYLDELSCSQGALYLLHQDLHADNILAANRSDWLAVDPKPLIGEREFAIAPLVRSSELGHSREQVLTRLDQLSQALELDRERARKWCIVQTVAWNLHDVPRPEAIEVVQWLI